MQQLRIISIDLLNSDPDLFDHTITDAASIMNSAL